MYMAMLVALTLAFPSCNVEMELGNNTLEYRERTAYLCSYDWQDDWYDDYGLHHFQMLRFYTNGTGEDFIRIQDAHGRWEEYTYTFTWDWYDAFYTSIRLNYGGGDYSYMDNSAWEKDEWNACSTVRQYASIVIKKISKKNRQIKRTKHEISLL